MHFNTRARYTHLHTKKSIRVMDGESRVIRNGKKEATMYRGAERRGKGEGIWVL